MFKPQGPVIECQGISENKRAKPLKIRRTELEGGGGREGEKKEATYMGKDRQIAYRRNFSDLFRRNTARH
jgi:hypothetical protein